MIKKIILYFIVSLLTIVNIEAKNFSKVATNQPILVQNGKSKYWCPVCGMDLKKFYKTSHIAKLHNGTKRQYCSIRCLVVDMQEYGIDKNSIKVIDAKTQKLIDATKAFYLVGSKIKGTMSKKSKLAFALKSDAVQFQKKYKGKIVDFNTALSLAKQSLKTDIAMINKKKKKKIYPMGKKLFKIKCQQKIDLTSYLEINELKSALKFNKLCKPLKGKQLQAVALYLWEVKRFGDIKNIEDKVVVKVDEKCPVCGMFTYKYPRWAAQIFFKHDNHIHHFSFDGVKDLMKFYFNPTKWGNYTQANKKNITKILVTDYYSQKGIDGTKAFYVIRSDILGPMGHELIPFQNLEDAKTFKEDHRGKAIIQFKDIKEEDVYKLDINEE